MRRKLMAGAICVMSIATGLLVGSPLIIGLTIASIVFLAVSYRFRLGLPAYWAGLLLYYPMGLILSAPLGIVNGFLVSAMVVIVLVERMSFENEISPVTEATFGADSETVELAKRLGSYHWRKLGEFVLLSSGVVGASLLLGTTSQYVQVLVSSTMILMFTVYAYARWTVHDRRKKGEKEEFADFLKRRWRRRYYQE